MRRNWRNKCLDIALYMMGHWQKQTELWVEPIHLGRRIPKEHLLRKISKALDLGFVRAEVAGFYGSTGNVSVDPVIIVKLMLLLFLDDIRSERELMRIVPLRLDYLWFLGYGLEDEVPNHSVLSKARGCWTKPASNPIHRRLVLTESVHSGFKNATLARRLFSMALSALLARALGAKHSGLSHRRYSKPQDHRQKA